MSYISALRKGNEVIVWEREGNKRIIKTFDAPWYFYVKDEYGEFTSIHGDKLAYHEFTTSGDFWDARDRLKNQGIKLFEADIPPELKILSQHYFEKPAPQLNITFYDIEVDYDPQIGFAGTANPYAPINSVAMYHQWKNEFVILAVPPKDGYTEEELRKKLDEIAPATAPYELVLCEDEHDLLLNFIMEVQECDVISGWNSDMFDDPYICMRIQQSLGKAFLKKLSFEHAEVPKFRDVETAWGGTVKTVDLIGRVNVDYMALFKKYEMAERASYKLENISNEVVPDLPKLQYEGSLHSLYRNDFAFFLRYNLRDVECLKGFEEKLGYVALANEMVHISTGLFKHVLGTLKLAELAINNYCHYKFDKKVPDWEEKPDDTIQGAYVLLPQVGKHDYLGSIDINSLYPSAIRSINISPETLRGQFEMEVVAAECIAQGTGDHLVLKLEDGGTEEYTAKQWRDVLTKRKWAVSGFGTVFDQHEKGIIPSVLEDWYAQRKTYKKKAGESFKKGDKEKGSYFDRLQYVYKIKLNSLYGALTNKFFRFYDLRMGQSTTGTGRMILRHQCAQAAKVLDGEYMLPDRKLVDEKDNRAEIGYSDQWSVIYGDTDSTYFKTHATNIEDAIKIADSVAEQVNASFPEFMRKAFLCTDGFDMLIQSGREVVADRGIFVDKKRYVLHVVDNEGQKVDKLKVMGLDTKKTTLPKEMQKKLNSFIERYLKGEEWGTIAKDVVDLKDELEHSNDIMVMGLPKGVKKVEHYSEQLSIYGEGTRLPGHVAASIFYNKCLEEFEDRESLPITSGMKIKVFYLKRPFGKFKSIALPTDAEFIPTWFKDNFVHLIDKDAQIERLVDNPLQNIIKAINQPIPTKQTLIMDRLLIFDDD